MKRVGLVAVGLLIAVLAAFFLYVDRIASTAIERGATHALGVDTRVGFARIGLLAGSFSVGGLSIANPPGFDTGHFLKLRDTRLDVGLGTLLEDTVVVPRFSLDGIDVVLERKGRDTNYGAILANLKRFESGKPSPRAEPPPGQAPGKKFVVKEFVITDITARIVAPQLLKQELVVKIPEIRVPELGSGRALSAAEVTNIVVKAVLGAVARSGADLPGALLSGLTGGLSGLTRVPSNVVGQVTSVGDTSVRALAGEAAGAVTDAAGQAGKAVEEQAGRALRGLFGMDEE